MVSPILIALLLTTVSCDDTLLISKPGQMESGAVPVESPETVAPEVVVSTPSPVSSSVPPTVTSLNSTTTATPVPVTSGAPVTATTDNEVDPAVTEQTVTEQIRTYIEDSVKSVKKAISKIGKFVGDLFEEASANSTTVAPVSTVFPASTLPPTSSNATSVPPK